MLDYPKPELAVNVLSTWMCFFGGFIGLFWDAAVPAIVFCFGSGIICLWQVKLNIEAL